jgi:hypothetical protein
VQHDRRAAIRAPDLESRRQGGFTDLRYASGDPVGIFRFGLCIPDNWLPWLDSYRTICIAPPPEARMVLEGLRDFGHVA